MKVFISSLLHLFITSSFHHFISSSLLLSSTSFIYSQFFQSQSYSNSISQLLHPISALHHFISSSHDLFMTSSLPPSSAGDFITAQSNEFLSSSNLLH